MKTVMSLAIFVSVTAGAVRQDTLFRARVESVRVDVLVTERGRAVTGLSRADFELRDEGVPQTIDLVSFEEAAVHATLVLDLSRSVSGDRLTSLRRGAGALLDGLRAGDRAALLTFNQFVTLQAPLGTDIAQVRTTLARAEPAGMTALVDASHTGLIVGQTDAGRALLLIFSDGVDTASWLAEDSVLATARRSNIVVYSVSVEEGGGRNQFLEQLTDFTGGRSLSAATSRDLSATFRAILDEFRQRYLLSYTPRVNTRPGWHALRVRVKGRHLDVRSRPGYTLR